MFCMVEYVITLFANRTNLVGLGLIRVNQKSQNRPKHMEYGTRDDVYRPRLNFIFRKRIMF